MDRCELIIYATPTGELANACDAYFARACELGATTAQTYPPHVTLTGFFRRSSVRREQIREVVGDWIDTSGHPPADAVTVDRLGIHDDWIGLEVSSPWLIDWTAALAERLPALPDEDALRLKDWLHLSLAYGIDELDAYRELALDLVEPTASAEWEVALWERSADGWSRLTGQ